MTTKPGAATFTDINERRRLVADLWGHGLNMREIADTLNIHTSMVSRDIRLWRKAQGLPPLNWTGRTP